MEGLTRKMERLSREMEGLERGREKLGRGRERLTRETEGLVRPGREELDRRVRDYIHPLIIIMIREIRILP